VGGQAEVVVSVMHDITLSEHFERVRDQFFSAAAHALKTPVTIILANAQLIARERDGRFQRSTDAIERQCARIDRLVQNLFVIARARLKTLELRPDELELGPLVERVVREANGASPRHEIRADLAAPGRVRADERRLALVVHNLVDEACHSSPAGSSIVVRLGRHGVDPEVAVLHRSRPPEDLNGGATGEYDELGIARCASTTIAEGHGGALGEGSEGAERSLWLRLRGAGAGG
jgi:signal transduction histidine kinase